MTDSLTEFVKKDYEHLYTKHGVEMVHDAILSNTTTQDVSVLIGYSRYVNMNAYASTEHRELSDAFKRSHNKL